MLLQHKALSLSLSLYFSVCVSRVVVGGGETLSCFTIYCIYDNEMDHTKEVWGRQEWMIARRMMDLS